MAGNNKALHVTSSLIGGVGPVGEPGDEPNAKIELLREAIKQTYDKNEIQLKTELNKDQISVFAKAKSFSKMFSVPLLDEIVTNIMENSLSLGRASRKEYENIVTGALSTVVNDEQGMPTLPERLFGKQ